MPSGTGKTVSLLSLIVSYQQVMHGLPFHIFALMRVVYLQVLSDQTQAHILFTNGPGDRKGSGRVEALNGVSDIVC